MSGGLQKPSVRQGILILILIPVAVLFVHRYFGHLLPDLPTAARVRAEEDLLEKRREQLRTLEDQRSARAAQLEELRSLAAPLWLIEDRNAARQKTLLQNEVNRVLAKANIRGVDYQVVNPRRLDLPDKTLIYEVEATVNMTASMREISRVLAEVDRSPQTLTWSQCSIAPLNLRDTSKVRLTGTLRARVLSPEAVALVRGGSEVPP
ncbi:MAG: hypothetical protein GX595_10450 [Lentisphaerae bacterium]|jgi:Tfp pilus assembly protein PilO|nr:hypothetical protein [Lentisphaerota bacterium]